MSDLFTADASSVAVTGATPSAGLEHANKNDKRKEIDIMAQHFTAE
jgi:hypothetical protein